MLDTELQPCLCYNCDIRNNGTAVRCWDAMKRELGYVDLKRYTRPYKIENKHNLYIAIDDGRGDLPDWDLPHPSAIWLIDTHLGLDERLRWARLFDYVFCAQKPSVERMAAEGIKNVHWLPLACHPSADPNIEEMLKHQKVADHCGGKNLNKQYDVCFVGFMNTGKADGTGNDRVDYLDRVFRRFPEFYFAYNRFFEDAAVRYIRARCGFNISIADDLNMRFFEIMSYGTCLVSNTDVVGWQDLGFVEGEHFVGYQGPDEAVEKVAWCLDHPFEREKIAQAGHRLVRERHTYAHRMQQLLDTCLGTGGGGNHKSATAEIPVEVSAYDV